LTTGVRTGVVASTRVAMAGATYLVATATVLPPGDVLLAGEPMGHRGGNAMASGTVLMTSVQSRSLSTSWIVGVGVFPPGGHTN